MGNKGYNTSFTVFQVCLQEDVIKHRKVAVFHMLPSGGGLRVLRQFIESIENDFDLSLHVPEGGSGQTEGSSIPETIYPYPMWKRPKGALRPVAPLFLIMRLLSFKNVCAKAAANMDRTADIALVHNCLPIAAPPVLQYLRIPSAYFCYEYPRHIYEKDIILRTGRVFTEIVLKPLTAIEKRMDLRSAEAATQIVTFSEYMQNSIKRIYGRTALIVRPGVDSTFFHPTESSLGNRNYVLSVGALWPFKGHETAIKIVGLLEKNLRPDIKIIADRGFPGYGEKLFMLAEALSVSLSIEHRITDASLRELYCGASAVLCCQRREPYGLVPLEAMACCTPVLALQEGGFEDNISHGQNGFLFNGDICAGAKYLLQILKKTDTVNHIRTAGRVFVVKNRSIAEGADNLRKILNSL